MASSLNSLDRGWRGCHEAEADVASLAKQASQASSTSFLLLLHSHSAKSLAPLPNHHHLDAAAAAVTAAASSGLGLWPRLTCPDTSQRPRRVYWASTINFARPAATLQSLTKPDLILIQTHYY